MSGWVLIVVAVPVLLVVALRLWFQWFSHRPLTSADQYAVTVDTAVDSANPRPLPPSPADRVTAPTATLSPPSPLVTPVDLTDRAAFAPSGPAATAWRHPTGGQRFIPHQRSATGDRALAEDHAAGPPPPCSGGPADR